MDVSVAEWLAWLTSNCGRIGAIGSSPSNGLRPNMWGQKGFNPLCQCVYIYVCIVKPDIQTIHRCSHTSIHTYINIYIHTTLIQTYIHTYYSHTNILHACTHTYIHTYIHTCEAKKGLISCASVYSYVYIVTPDIQKIQRCIHTSVHTSQCCKSVTEHGQLNSETFPQSKIIFYGAGFFGPTFGKSNILSEPNQFGGKNNKRY